MAQTKLNGEGNLNKGEVDQISKEMTTKKFIKKAKRERRTSDLGQRRLSGDRIHKKTIGFHETKEARKKASKRRRHKVNEEKMQRKEQVTLF